MRTFRLWAGFFLLVLGMFFFQVYGVYAQKPQQLSDLIDQAIANNPEIQQAYSRWQAAKNKITSARSLPDPIVHYTYFGEKVETRVGPQEKKYGASQKIPFPAKLYFKARAQAKEAAVWEQKYEARKREIAKKVKFVFYDIFWVDKAIQITESEKAIVESLEKVAQKKYESNLTPQQDVIKAGVELTRLIDKLIFLRQNRNSLVAKLNSILNRPADTPVSPVAGLKPEEFDYSLPALKELARKTSQDLSAAQINVQRAAYEKSLAQMGFFPDITLGYERIEVEGATSAHPQDGKDAWMATVALSVPFWFDRTLAQVEEKKHMLEAAQGGRQNTENMLIYEVEDMFYKLSAYKEIIGLYKNSLLPQAEQAYEAAQTSYQTGKTDFLNWLDAERMLLATRLAYYKAIVDYQKSRAYLERVVGEDL